VKASRTLRVLALNHDAGGANALVPVIRHLQRELAIDVSVVGGPFAAEVFRRRRLAFRTPADYGPASGLKEQAAAIIARERPDVVFSGASWGETIEKFAWDNAAEMGVPSLALLDMWCMYWQRFGDVATGRRFTHVPTCVAVMDDTARQGLLQAGFSAEQVRVTGQPHFDYLRAMRGRASERGAAWRRSLGLSRNGFLVLFASESHSADLGRDASSPHYLGYTEQDVLGGLVHVLEGLRRRAGRPIELVVKLHPKETEAPVLHTGFPVRVLRQGDPLQMIGGADAVVGMTSMLLVEAAVIGHPALSFQPIPPQHDTMWPNRIGVTQPIYTSRGLAAALREVMKGPQAVRQPDGLNGLADGKAAQRVAEVILTLGQKGRG
jgi:hypothetical protein